MARRDSLIGFPHKSSPRSPLVSPPARAANLSLTPTVLAFLVLITSIVFSGCATNSDLYLRDELANRGPQGLSGTNPYLTPNLFVANEMKHSEVFRGFIRYRGTPDAVEVRTAYFKALRVYLFYLGENEAFLMERGSKDWLVRGPDKIPQQLMASFFNMAAPGPNAPLAIESSESAHEALPPPPVARRPQLEQMNQDEEPEIKSLRKVPTRPQANKPKPPPAAPKELKEDDLASTVKESTSGDLIHRVTFQGESLRLISNWYTGDIDNTGRIARINGIENPDLLRVGETVRIPRYLLKTTKPMPQNEIKRFDAEFGH